MKSPFTKTLFSTLLLFTGLYSCAQLVITNNPNALLLAQKLVGDGVTISNISFTGNRNMAASFQNFGGINFAIDSGIVLTSGRAKTLRSPDIGVDGDGITQAQNILANNSWALPGDADLAAAIGLPVTDLEDACVLEFDFVPLGDTIRFNYVFSSEEYTPAFVCGFNDAFAFFISGPGIPGLQNIALIPGTTTPVSIFNVNKVPGGACPNNGAYYTDNRTNTFFTHDGHTTLLTAVSAVVPCQTYHLKIVISDVSDDQFDTGVFLQARSLTSNVIGITNLTQTDPSSGISYLVEGCATGSFTIRRPRKDSSPLSVMLSYGGAALNSIDVQTLPTSVIIPANDSFVTINVIPLTDGIPEGIEELRVYALAGCAPATPTDSTVIQIRDYDILSLSPDTAFICKGSSVPLTASTGYSTYLWINDPTLSNITIRNPVATPVNSNTTYICTAIEGTCHARDSVLLKLKDIELISSSAVNCRGESTGNIKMGAGSEWKAPVEFSLDGINWQADSNFHNLPAGVYSVKARDIDCIDSVIVNVIQAFPDLIINNVAITPASCSGNPDGVINIIAGGGSNTYLYSLDSINFQGSNLFRVLQGNYSITLKDNNGCIAAQNVTIPVNNTVSIDAGSDASICEGTSYILPAVSNGTSFLWIPNGTVSNAALLTPTAFPAITTKYYVEATTGICKSKDSVIINVRPAPVADAGPDSAFCFGKVFQLNGSGGATYQWSPSAYFISPASEQAPSVKATADITYHLMVKDATGCSSLRDDAIKIDVVPTVKIFAGRDTVAAINQPIQLKVVDLANSGVTQYSWSPGLFLNNTTIENPIALLPNDYRYIVTGTTAEGCEGKDDVFIKVYKGPEIYVPSGFTPDNNGLNDMLRPVPVGIKEFRFFRVFNRWGQLVFSSPDPNRGWDGNINGTKQPTGSYVWMAEAIDYKGNLIIRKGSVTIIR